MTGRPVVVSPRVERDVELTRIQREVWASQRLHRDAPLANMATAHRITGPIDADRFVAAFDAVVAANGALRTVIGDADGRPVARVLASTPASTSVIDLDVDEVADWCAQRVAVAVDATTCSFDSVLIRHAPDEWTWWLDLHHVVTDGHSQGLVYRLTSDAYGALGRGHDVELATIDFVDHSSRLAVDDAPTSSHAAAPVAPFGPHRSPPGTAASRSVVPLTTDPALIPERYRALSAELSSAAVCAAALAMTMHRLDGRSDYAIGVPVHHRSGSATRVVGPLMELHAIDVRVDPDDTFESLVHRVLASIIDMLRAVRSGTHERRAFDLVVNVFTADYGDFDSLPVDARWVRAPHVDPNHLVRLHGFDYGRGLELELDVNDALGSRHRPMRLAEHVGRLIDAMVADPSLPIDAAPILTVDDAAEMAALVPEPPPGPERPVHDTIREALRSDPDWVVATDDDGDVTAAAFDDRVDRCVGWLQSNGVAAGSRVGVRLARSIDAIVAMHAVLRAGASFVMLDPDDPQARHEAIRSDAALALIIDDLDDVSPDQAPGIDVPVGLDDIAYVLYTSGSTGEPKGVPISHRGLADYLDFARSTYCQRDRPPVVALHSKLVFDLTITSLFLSFVSGGTVAVFAGEPVVALGRIAADERVTFVKATPSQLEVFARMVDSPRAIDTVVVGGEAFRRPVAVATAAVCAPDVRIFNEYGPTEAVVGCMIHEWDPEVDDGIDVPIGTAAPGCEVAVLDRYWHPTPAGSWGELYVRRVGMATGYLNRPDLTAELFGDLPDMPGELGGTERGPWYRTGDRVRLERPGVATYGGRFDDQMKVNGVRLEPAEIEAALVAHPSIANAIVRLWTPSQRTSTNRCVRCGLGDDVPGIELDAELVCSTCRSFDAVAPQADTWFRDTADLDAELARARARSTGDYDCLHLLSGGKDSSYALYQLVERGWRVHALTLDNGFISEGAKENVRQSIDALGITHEFVTTESMNEIFRDSLDRYSNVCQGCYKTIYTMAVARADALGIPVVVTGLSRGQFFETRLIPAQFEAGRFDPEAIDATVLAARKVYHQVPDAVTRLLPEQRVFDDATVFDRVEFLDFYRYVDVDLAELYRYLEENAPWVRPADTGRSTNCLINVAGIQVHKAERGYHNYAEPYSWDVRLGHKTRDEALEELDDEVDDTEVARMLGEIAYEPKQVSVLTAWYETVDGAPLDPSELRRFVRDGVAEHGVPAAFVHIDEVPMSASAKADTAALPAPLRVHRHGDAIVAPDTSTEAAICEIWAEVLRLERVGVVDDFFDLGGDSLAALEVVAAIADTLHADLDDAAVFDARTVRELAALVESTTDGRPLVDSLPVPTLDAGAPAPLSAGEEAMLFDYRRDPSDTRYNVTRHYRLPVDTDLERLEAAIADVVTLHGPLRTSYASDRRRLDAPMSFDALDALSLAEFSRFASEQCAAPFDLDAGPLVRVHAALTGDSMSVLIAMHHISVDAGSFDVFWNQVSAVYAGAPAPELTSTYAEHGAWQRSSVDPAHAAHWATVSAADDVEPARLGFAAPVRPEADGYLEQPLAIGAQQLRRISTSTPFVTSLAAAGATIAGHSRGRAVEVGITASVKDHPATTDMVGYFLNTLPIRIEIDPNDTPASLTRRLDPVVARAIEHRTHPFASIVRDARSAGHRAPDVSYMLAYERLDPAELGGVPVEHQILASGTAVADVTFFVQERGDDLTIGIEYSGHAIGRTDAQRLLDAFGTSLVAAVEAPDSPVSPSNADVSEIDGPALLDVPPTVLHELLDRVLETPDADAVVDSSGTSLSYRELMSAVLDTAERIPAGADFVGVSIERSVEMVVALLAAQFAGAAYVPLDPTSPPERLASIIGQIDLACVLTDEATADRYDESLVVQHPWSASHVDQSDESDERIGSVDTDDHAYVIFTSGSTGTPRGVAVSHANLAASTAARRSAYAERPDTFLLTSSIGFDSSIVGLFWTLTSGGTIVIPSDDEVHDVDRLVSAIETHGVTHVLMVPSLYRAVLTRGASRLDSLRTSIVAGEACPSDVAELHVSMLGDRIDLYNEYGPTEATVWTTYHRVSAGESDVPIGRPIAGVTVRVADDSLAAVPVGVAGELLVAGATVTAGYLADDASTDARFVEVDGRRWYRTGDLVRQRGDGALDFCGRVDDQLNVGGVRLEPTDVESVLLGIDDVDDAVVVATDEARPRLVAHVVGRDVDEVAIRSALGDRLPSTHIPARIVAHDALPRTSHGKLDRRAAAAFPVEQSLEPASAEAPQLLPSGLHDVVLEVWRDALGRVDVGRDTDYFAAGGDSLAAVEIVSALEDRLGRPLAIGMLLEGRTPAGMAALLAPDESGADAGDAVTTSRLVIMQDGSDAGPIVVLTPGWDDVFGYQALTAALPDDLTIVALSAADVPSTDIVTTIPELATSFADRLSEHDTIRRGRPVTILGWSTGGVVAYELARQLRNDGHAVERVAMVDSFFPGAEQHLWSNRWWKYKSLLAPSAFAAEVKVTAVRRSRAAAKRAGTKLLEFAGTDVPDEPKRTSTGGVPFEAFSYRPDRIGIDVVMYAATTTNPDRTFNGWRTVADVEVLPVVGRHRGHDSIMDAGRVDAIADDLARRLASDRESGS